MKEKRQTITFLGGDERCVYAAKELSARGFYVASGVEDGAVAAVIPINQKGCAIKTESGDVSLSDAVRRMKNAAFFGGEPTAEMSYALGGRTYFDLTKDEAFAAENAILTAEGALGIMIDRMPFSVRGTRLYVLGYGRIGRALTPMLCSLGAVVTVFARSVSARQEAEKYCNALDFPNFQAGADCVINTIPSSALSPAQKEMIGGAYVIELASAPGGFSFDERAALGEKFIHAPGLPGKTAPISAGKIIGKAIFDILKGEKLKC